ncbi:MAG: hypothetical protein ACO1RA_00010 [Planctomycetaceae bacterium]
MITTSKSNVAAGTTYALIIAFAASLSGCNRTPSQTKAGPSKTEIIRHDITFRDGKTSDDMAVYSIACKLPDEVPTAIATVNAYQDGKVRKLLSVEIANVDGRDNLVDIASHYKGANEDGAFSLRFGSGGTCREILSQALLVDRETRLIASTDHLPFVINPGDRNIFLFRQVFRSVGDDGTAGLSLDGYEDIAVTGDIVVPEEMTKLSAKHPEIIFVICTIDTILPGDKK